MSSNRRDTFFAFLRAHELRNIQQDIFAAVVVGKHQDAPGTETAAAEEEVNQFIEMSHGYEKECEVHDEVGLDTIQFTTACPGRPHLIKTSYYPNWKIEGANRIFLVSPGLMMVIPHQTQVKMYYGRLPEDVVGEIGSVLSIIGCLAFALWSGFRRRLGT
jgi:hypothetical protein